jgi:flagellar hook-associated protein 2
MIPGVTLNLKSSDAGTTVTVQVAARTSDAKQAITDFVDQYNSLMDYINPQFKYDAATQTAGTLFADSRLISIVSDLRSKISNPISGIGGSIKVLSQIGVTSTTNDKLEIDGTKLDNALADNLHDVLHLFSKIGEAANGNVTYVASSYKTKPSSASGYAVNITQAATQSYVTAGVAQTSALAQDETLTINGVEIALSTGMTQSQVAGKINESTAQTGVNASVTGGTFLTLTRVGYGSGPHITVKSSLSSSQNPGANSGIGNASVTDADPDGESGQGEGAVGLNVQGTINGEAATGSGMYLTGNSGNANTDSLKIRITGSATGDYGTIVFTRGIGGLVGDFAADLTAIVTGSVASATSSLQDQISDLDDEKARLEAILATQEERLYAQFNAMENALSRLQTQSDFLTQQLGTG